MAFQILEEKAALKKLLHKCSIPVKTQNAIEENISSIVTCTGFASIVSEDKNKDSYFISGKVEARVLFEDENKTLSSTTIYLDFDEKINIDIHEWMYSIPTVTKIKATMASSNRLEVNAIVDVDIYGAIKQDIKYISAGDEDVECKNSVVTIQELACATCDTFAIQDTIEFAENITKLIAVYPSYNIKNISSYDNYISIDGETNVEVICMCGENLRKFNKSNDFKEEVALVGCKKDMLVDASIRLQNIESSFEVFEDQNKSNVNISLAYKVNSFGFTNKDVCMVEDMFSTKYKTLLTSECFENTSFVGQEILNEKLNYNYDTSNGMRIDEVIAVNNTSVDILKAVVCDDQLSIDMVIAADVIYKNYELDNVFCMRAEIPMSTSTKVLNANNVNASAQAEVVNYKNRAGKELYLLFDVNIVATCYNSNLINYVKDATYGEKYDENDNLFTIYMPSNDEKLFDACKKLLVNCDTLKEQNIDITDGNLPDRIVLYHKQ